MTQLNSKLHCGDFVRMVHSCDLQPLPDFHIRPHAGLAGGASPQEAHGVWREGCVGEWRVWRSGGCVGEWRGVWTEECGLWSGLHQPAPGLWPPCKHPQYPQLPGPALFILLRRLPDSFPAGHGLVAWTSNRELPGPPGPPGPPRAPWAPRASLGRCAPGRDDLAGPRPEVAGRPAGPPGKTPDRP